MAAALMGGQWLSDESAEQRWSQANSAKDTAFRLRGFYQFRCQ